MKPRVIKGNYSKDERGQVIFNNDFDATPIRRIYFIENRDTNFVRAWQGHAIEQRFFSAIQGSFLIKLVAIENWEHPDKNAEILNFELNANSGDVLHIPAGYLNSIQALEEDSKILAMANFAMNETNDDHRFPADYFNIKSE